MKKFIDGTKIIELNKEAIIWTKTDGTWVSETGERAPFLNEERIGVKDGFKLIFEPVPNKPEWTVLSLVNSEGGRSTLRSNGKFANVLSTGNGLISFESINWNIWKIESVRRESDGQIFTIGETYIFRGYKEIKSTLKKITIRTYTPFDIRLWADYTTDQSSAYDIDRLTPIKKEKLKEWEITAIQNVSTRILLHLKKNGLYSALPGDGVYSSEDLLANKPICHSSKGFQIYSVERLSDNVEFTLGESSSTGKIKRFYFKDGYIGYESGEHTSWVGYKVWNKAQKIFTTEDGVDIFVGDTVVVVNKKLLIITNRLLEIIPSYVDGNWDSSNGYIQFSTVEAAKEYIAYNKQCLSINDLKEHCGITPNETIEVYYEALLKLVKSRL